MCGARLRKVRPPQLIEPSRGTNSLAVKEVKFNCPIAVGRNVALSEEIAALPFDLSLIRPRLRLLPPGGVGATARTLHLVHKSREVTRLIRTFARRRLKQRRVQRLPRAAIAGWGSGVGTALDLDPADSRFWREAPRVGGARGLALGHPSSNRRHRHRRRHRAPSLYFSSCPSPSRRDEPLVTPFTDSGSLHGLTAPSLRRLELVTAAPSTNDKPPPPTAAAAAAA
ncbi:unnamed protein product [Lampetra fluviatilis]